MDWDSLTEIMLAGPAAARERNVEIEQAFIEDGPPELRELRALCYEKRRLAVDAITKKNLLMQRLRQVRNEQCPNEGQIVELERELSGAEMRVVEAKEIATQIGHRLESETDRLLSQEFPEQHREQALEIMRELRTLTGPGFPTEGRELEVWNSLTSCYLRLGLKVYRAEEDKRLLLDRLRDLQAEFDDIRRPEKERLARRRKELEDQLLHLRSAAE